MKLLLPHVTGLRREDEPSAAQALVLDLHVPPGLEYFDGHFPGLEILPGVVQLDWAVRFAREHLEMRGEARLLENVKFLAIVRPDARLALRLSRDADGRRLEFAYAGAGRRYSSGRVLYEARA